MKNRSLKVFNDIDTFLSLKDTIFQLLLNYPQNNYMNETSQLEAINALQNMDEKQQEYFVKYVKHIDRKMSVPSAAKGNLFHKLPTVLAGSIYIGKYFEQTRVLTLDEIMVLSGFSIFEPIEFYQGAIPYLSKELLSSVATKHFDYTFQWLLLDYAASKINKGETKETVATYIKQTPIKQLTEESYEYEKQVLQEAGFYI